MRLGTNAQLHESSYNDNPMDERQPTDEFLARLEAGDREAAEELHAQYCKRLIFLVRQRLRPKLAARLDAEDVVQSVFRTFFRRCEAGEFQFENAASLWTLLAAIAVRKAAARTRHHNAQCRDVSAEVSEGENALPNIPTADPEPEEVVALIDLIEAWPEHQPVLHKDVLEQLLAGYSVKEIARESQVSRQTVYRIKQRLQHWLQGHLASHYG